MSELCFCNKNFNGCDKECINSEFKKSLKKLISVENQGNKDMQSDSQCFFTGCKSKGINSHTIARSQLEEISIDNKVLIINDGIIHKIYPQKHDKLKSLSIEDTFTFKGFCNPGHEDIFNKKPYDVDHGDFIIDDYSIQLILYRYLCRRIKMNYIESEDINLTKNNSGINKLLELGMVKLAFSWDDMKLWNTRDLLVNNHLKSQLELLIHSRELYKPSEPEWAFKEFISNSSPKFLGTFHLKVFSMHMPLQYETLGHAYINKNNKWAFFLATKKHNKDGMKFINSIKKDDIPYAIFWNLCKTGQIAINPSLSNQEKERLVNFCFGEVQSSILEMQKAKKLNFMF